MNKEIKKQSAGHLALSENLSKLTANQFKAFFTALVHYWSEQKFFITNRSFYNLGCEFNVRCRELDESFPDLDDQDAVKKFWHYHPYHFIDCLPLGSVAKLIAEHVDDRIDILAGFAKRLADEDMHAAYTYMNGALGLDESVDDLVAGTKAHVKFFSY